MIKKLLVEDDRLDIDNKSFKWKRNKISYFNLERVWIAIEAI